MPDGRTALTGAERKRRYDRRVWDGLIYVRGGLPSVAVLRCRRLLPTRKRHNVVATAEPPPLGVPLPLRRYIHGRFSMFGTVCFRRCLCRR